MNERQTARELPRVIATCTVPKKMRPEDLPKFPEQRLVIELRLAYLSVCKLYLCLRIQQEWREELGQMATSSNIMLWN